MQAITTQTKIKQLFTDMDNEFYHASAGLSASGVRLMLDCPHRYWFQYLSGDYVKPDTKALHLGSALHTLALEPEKFAERYAIAPICDRRTKVGKATYEQFMEQHCDKHHLKQDDCHQVMQMSKAIRNSPFFKACITDTGCVEHSLFWVDANGAQLKARPDFYCPRLKIIVDVKSTDSVNPDDFRISVLKYGYDTQAALQIDGVEEFTNEIYTHILLAVEKEQPYIVKPYMLPQAMIDKGRAKYKKASYEYQECIKDNHWPAYGNGVSVLEFKDWDYK